MKKREINHRQNQRQTLKEAMKSVATRGLELLERDGIKLLIENEDVALVGKLAAIDHLNKGFNKAFIELGKFRVDILLGIVKLLISSRQELKGLPVEDATGKTITADVALEDLFEQIFSTGTAWAKGVKNILVRPGENVDPDIRLILMAIIEDTWLMEEGEDRSVIEKDELLKRRAHLLSRIENFVPQQSEELTKIIVQAVRSDVPLPLRDIPADAAIFGGTRQMLEEKIRAAENEKNSEPKNLKM